MYLKYFLHFELQQHVLMQIEIELADGKLIFEQSGNAQYPAEIFEKLFNDDAVKKFFKQIKKEDLNNIDKLIDYAKNAVSFKMRRQDIQAIKTLHQALLFENDFTTIFMEQLYGFKPTAENIIAYALNLALHGNDEVDYARLSVNKSRIRLSEMFAQVFQKELEGAISRMNKDISGEKKASEVKLSHYFNQKTLVQKLNQQSTYRLNELLQLAETASPLEELSLIYSIKVSGPDGLKEEQEMRDLGILPKENMGIISAYDTPENNNTSRVNRLTLNAIVQNYTGSLTSFNKDVLTTSFGLLSPIEAMIPFIEHNDGNRILLATNQLKSIVPTEKTEPPIIQTGAEQIIPQLSSNIFTINASDDGKVIKKGDNYVIIKYKDGTTKFIDTSARIIRTGKGFYTLPMRVLVNEGAEVKKGQMIARSSYINANTKLQLGNNVLVAFMHYKGHTFEDGIVVSETYAKKFGVTRRSEIVTIPIFEDEIIEDLNIEIDKFMSPNKPLIVISSKHLLKEDEIELSADAAVNVEFNNNRKIYKGTKGGRIKEVQIYTNIKDFSKVTNKPEIKEKLMQLYDKFKPVYEDYLNAYQSAEPETDSRYLIKDGNEKYKYFDKTPYVILRIEFEKFTWADIGDKLCNRHGNKGVIAEILPDSQMPVTEYGERIDVILDPLGVINRMNLGQVYEAAVAYICKHLYLREVKDINSFKKVFNTFYRTFYNDAPEIVNYLKNLTEADYAQLYNEAKYIEAIPLIILPFNSPFKQKQDLIKELENKFSIKTEQYLLLPDVNAKTVFPVQIGYMYLFRLEHVTEEVVHARFIGSRDELTNQAKKGRKSGGGFAFGEFDSWQMLSYDVPAVVAEIAFVNAEAQEFNDMLSDIMMQGKANLPNKLEKIPTQKILETILTALYIKPNI